MSLGRKNLTSQKYQNKNVKKIDVLIPDFSDLGAQRVAINVANSLCKIHNIRFIVFSENGPFKHYLNSKIEIVILDKKILNIPKIRVFFRLGAYAKEVKKNKIDLAISFSPITNFTILWAKFINKKLKTIIQEHAFPTLFLKDRENINFLGEFFYKFILVKFYNFSDIFITLTEKIRKEFIDNFNIKNDLNYFRIIKNPIDVENIQRLSKENISDFIFNKDKKYLIGAGRLAEQKNFFRLIDIFSLITEKIPKIELIILGAGPLEQKLKDYSIKLQLKNKINFLGFKSNPYSYIKNADIFCLTSNWEALPQIIAETMIIETIVIANNCPTGPAEMIEDGKTGILIPYENTSLFVEKILWILKNQEIKKQIERNAYNFALEEYSLEKCLKSYLAIIDYLFPS